MHSNKIIQDELNELSPLLAGISNKNIFTVPEGYFDTLPNELLFSVNQPQITVPEGYFDSLADNILSKIKLNAASNISTDEHSVLLAPVQHINVYKVPDNYFEQLAIDILRKIPQPARVIVMHKRSSFFNYAAAAVITGILGLSLFTAFDKKTSTERSSAVVLAQAGKIVKDKSFDQVLETISDEDIVHYLQNNGQDVNAALVASVTDEKTLPNPEDYFIDDKTLDNFLNDLNIKQTTNN